MAVRNSHNPRSRTLYYYYCPKARKRKNGHRLCANSSFFRADQVDTTVWNSIRSYLEDPQRLKIGLDMFINQNQQALSPIKERKDIVENLLTDEMSQLKKVTDLYIDGTFSKKRLMQHKKQIEGRLSRLTNEFAELSERYQTWSYFPQQTEKLKKFIAGISGRLKEADDRFDHRRKIIEFLDVNVALDFHDDKRSAKMIFAFGEIVLTIKSHKQGVSQ
jgi:hypothetical protein